MTPPHHRRHLAALKQNRQKPTPRKPSPELPLTSIFATTKTPHPSPSSALPSALTAQIKKTKDDDLFLSCESDELRAACTPTRLCTPFAGLTGDRSRGGNSNPNKMVDLPSPKFGADSGAAAAESITTPSHWMPRLPAARFSFMPHNDEERAALMGQEEKEGRDEKKEPTLTQEETCEGTSVSELNSNETELPTAPSLEPPTVDNEKKELPPANSRQKSSRMRRHVVSTSEEEEEGDKERLSSPDLPVSEPEETRNRHTPIKKSLVSKAKTASRPVRGDLSTNKITPRNRGVLAAEWYERFNAVVFDKQLPAGLTISWNARARRTAGFTRFTRLDREFTSHGDDGEEEEDDEDLVKRLDLTPRRQRHDLQVKCIDLSTKLLTDEFRLAKTLLHECCHVAQRVLEDVVDTPHGPLFKKWANIATAKFPQFKVARCHDYAVQPPHQWVCDTCAHVYRRFSRSIDPSKHACGAKECKGHLRYIGALSKQGTMRTPTTRDPSAYQLFVKTHYHEVSKEVGPADRAAIMKTLASMWKASREGGGNSVAAGD